MKIPRHIVLFPDGNRRWALKKNLPAAQGHLKGRENFKNFLSGVKKRGVRILTVFGFSTENWNRSKREVNFLMKLFEEGLSEKGTLGKLHKQGVKIKIIGQKEKIPKSLKKVIEKIEKLTENNKKFHLNLAISYGGKWDIIQAVQKIIKEKISPEKITENLISKYLTTAGLPNPDLIIRAGGEKRFSNFLLWQSAYAELYFSDKLWPDFSEEDLNKALKDFTQRERRFGGKKV